MTLGASDTIDDSRGGITGGINAGASDTFDYHGLFGNETIDTFTGGTGSTHDTIQFAANDFGIFTAVQSAMSQVGADTVIRLDATELDHAGRRHEVEPRFRRFQVRVRRETVQLARSPRSAGEGTGQADCKTQAIGERFALADHRDAGLRRVASPLLSRRSRRSSTPRRCSRTARRGRSPSSVLSTLVAPQCDLRQPYDAVEPPFCYGNLGNRETLP